MSERNAKRWLALGAMVWTAAGPASAEIVGGKSINISEAPWQLHLNVDQGGGVSSGCGAVWLGGVWGVTAYHCIEDAAASATTLVGGITKLSEDKPTLRVKAKRIVPYNNGGDIFKGDIALIELVAPITAPLAKTIRWATPADVTAGLTKPGAWCMASGWGALSKAYNWPDALQAVESKLYNSNQAFVIQWAGAKSGPEIGSCQGDSGGPLVGKDAAGNFVLIGISSYIQSFCGDPANPSSYARVSAFASWIQTTTGIATGVAPPSADEVRISGGNLRLARAGQVEVSFANLAGAQVLSLDRYYAAGDHALPTAGLSAGQYVLRVRGDKLDIRQALTVGRR